MSSIFNLFKETSHGKTLYIAEVCYIRIWTHAHLCNVTGCHNNASKHYINSYYYYRCYKDITALPIFTLLVNCIFHIPKQKSRHATDLNKFPLSDTHALKGKLIQVAFSFYFLCFFLLPSSIYPQIGLHNSGKELIACTIGLSL